MRRTSHEHGRRGCIVVGGQPEVGCAVASRFAWGGYSPALLLEQPGEARGLVDVESGPERNISIHHALSDDVESLFSATDMAQARIGTPSVVCYVARPVDGGDEASLADHLDALTSNLNCASLLAQELVPRMAEQGGGAFLLVTTDVDGHECSALSALVHTLRRSSYGRCVDAELVRSAQLLGQVGVGATAPLDFADACWRARIRGTREPSQRLWLN